MNIIIANREDLADLEERVLHEADVTADLLNRDNGTNLKKLFDIKFEKQSTDIITQKNINIVEQINRIWLLLAIVHGIRFIWNTNKNEARFTITLVAGKWEVPHITTTDNKDIAAEVVAAINLNGNDRIKMSASRLMSAGYRKKYIFTMSSNSGVTKRQPASERGDVEVWALRPPLE